MKILFYKDKSSKWRWRIVSGNSRIVASSSEGYYSKWNAKRNLRKVLRQNTEYQ